MAAHSGEVEGSTAATGAAARDRARLHTKPTLWAAGILLALAIVLPLWVSSYAKDTPRLWGFPFFYWYQLLWVFLCAALVTIAHQLLLRDERRRRERLRAGRGTGSAGQGVVK